MSNGIDLLVGTIGFLRLIKGWVKGIEITAVQMILNIP